MLYEEAGREIEPRPLPFASPMLSYATTPASVISRLASPTSGSGAAYLSAATSNQMNGHPFSGCSLMDAEGADTQNDLMADTIFGATSRKMRTRIDAEIEIRLVSDDRNNNNCHSHLLHRFLLSIFIFLMIILILCIA